MTTTQTRTTDRAGSRRPAPAAPAPVPALPRFLGRRRRSVALGLLVSAQFVVMLDTSIVNVALPSIQADLGFGPTGITWVVNAYVLTFGSLLLMSGRAADLFGRRRMFVAGSTLFAAGTLLAAGAANPAMLVAGRIIQGTGAAALSPAAMSLLLLTFPGPARARAMSIWGAASGLGGATGVFLGGLLAGGLGWSSVFLVTVPVSTAAVLLARQVLEEGPRGPRRRFDWRGAATITGAVIALVHAALGVPESGWTSIPVLASLAGFAGLLAAFVVLEGRTADPLVPLELLRSRVMRTGLALAVFGGAARASAFVLVALYLQQALAMAPQRAGMAMVPTSVTGFVVSLALLPRLLRALGPRRTMVIGLVVLAAGHLWLGHAPAHTGYLVAVSARAAARRGRRRAQLHAHHHGDRLGGPRCSRRAGIGARRLDEPGRRGARHGHVHRDRHRGRWRGRQHPDLSRGSRRPSPPRESSHSVPLSWVSRSRAVRREAAPHS